MKKMLAWILSLCLLLAVGCQKGNAQPAAAPVATEAAVAAEPTAAPAAEATPEPITVRIAALKGPTGMGLAYLMAENQGAYQVDIYDAPDAITGKLVSGEVDIAAVPINLASALYNKTSGGVVMLAVNTLGVLYIIEDGDTVQSMADLAGKTLYATGQGSTPEYVLNYLLEKNGLTDQVTVEYVGEHAALAAMLAGGEAKLGMLPEPNVSSVLLKNENARIALDLNAEWNAAAGQQLMQGCYVASRAFYEAHPEAVAQYISDCAASVEKVNTEADAGEVVAAQGILPAAAIAAKAIPNSNIVCITGAEMKALSTGMLEVLYAANPASVGGKLPDDGLYAD